MFVKTLEKHFIINKFMIIDSSLFSKVKSFEFKHYTVLCRLISTVQENIKRIGN